MERFESTPVTRMRLPARKPIFNPLILSFRRPPFSGTPHDRPATPNRGRARSGPRGAGFAGAAAPWEARSARGPLPRALVPGTRSCPPSGRCPSGCEARSASTVVPYCLASENRVSPCRILWVRTLGRALETRAGGVGVARPCGAALLLLAGAESSAPTAGPARPPDAAGAGVARHQHGLAGRDLLARADVIGFAQLGLADAEALGDGRVGSPRREVDLPGAQVALVVGQVGVEYLDAVGRQQQRGRVVAADDRAVERGLSALNSSSGISASLAAISRSMSLFLRTVTK